METTGGDARGGGSFLGMLVALGLVLLAGLIVWILTEHLGSVRPGDIESRLDTWSRLEQRVRNRKNNDGSDYYAASCMLSTVRSIGSIHQGEPNPHFKLAACKAGVCDYAIIGVLFDEPAVVTARGGVPISQYKTECRKDMCINVPVDDVIRVLNGALP